MTQPTSINQTFDTSLIDIYQHHQQQITNRSFSSTETNTSGSSSSKTDVHAQRQPISHKAAMPTPEPFTTVSNARLYDTWAQTYDTDGNVLQAVDDLELVNLLPEFVRLVSRIAAAGQVLKVLDFGCGTGRNTVKLLEADWSTANGQPLEVEVQGWDASAAMLALASQKCTAAIVSANVRLAPSGLQRRDFTPSTLASSPEIHGSFTAIISTLVLEHLPLPDFMAHIATLLQPGGYALITNMHPDMGSVTKAGYKTESGERVKGESWVHGVEESVEAARKAGLEVVREVGVREREVEESMLGEGGSVGKRGGKWVGVKVWYGFIIRKREM